jgi:hypothetical protein
MPKYAFDVLFNYRQGNITISFEDKLQAEAYKRKTGDKYTLSTHRNGPYEINLPRLVDLDYIRCSDHTNDLIFVFVDEKAASAWKKDLALVSRDGNEARIKRSFRSGELDSILGVKEKDYHANERLDKKGKAKDGKVKRAFTSRDY